MRTALVLMVVLGTTTPTWAAQRLVVLPSQWLEGAKADISPRLVDDAILAAAARARRYHFRARVLSVALTLH